MLPSLTLVLGGAASGKSAYAEGLAMRAAPSRLYLATAQTWDEEMRQKVARHRARRQQGWATIEAPLQLGAALLQAPADGVVLLDCATMWLSNHLLVGHDIETETVQLLADLAACPCPVVVVSNELGLSVVPENALARQFRQAQGELNQRLAAQAGLVAFVVAGLPLAMKRGAAMSRFFWVRHGPTHAKTMVGWSDLPADLSDVAQLQRLQAFLPSDALVISSDLQRAVATADAIAGVRMRLSHDPDLREMHFGAWELQRFDEVEDQALIRQFWENPGHVRPPGGESWHQLVQRVDGAVARLCAAHPGRDIVVVAHFGAILTQVQTALQLGAYETFAHKIDNLSVTEITRKGQGWGLGRLNHLP